MAEIATTIRTSTGHSGHSLESCPVCPSVDTGQSGHLSEMSGVQGGRNRLCRTAAPASQVGVGGFGNWFLLAANQVSSPIRRESPIPAGHRGRSCLLRGGVVGHGLQHQYPAKVASPLAGFPARVGLGRQADARRFTNPKNSRKNPPVQKNRRTAGSPNDEGKPIAIMGKRMSPVGSVSTDARLRSASTD